MWYREGTITFSKGSDILTGNGTSWNVTANGVLPGMIVVGPDNRLYEIKRVNDNTSLQLVEAYSGETQSDIPCCIITTYEGDLTQFSARFTALMNRMSSDSKMMRSWLTAIDEVTLEAEDGTEITVKSLQQIVNEHNEAQQWYEDHVDTIESESSKAIAAAERSETAASQAEISQSAAALSESNTKESETAAALSESNAKTSELAAASSEENAASSEASAAASKEAAGISEVNSKASETSAAKSQEAAAQSETNAKESEVSAAASQQAAAASESNAKESELAALSSQTAASESEKNALASEQAAAASQQAASESQLSASESAASAKEDAERSSEAATRAEEAAKSVDADTLVHRDSNLSDLTDPDVARQNLGIGTIATQDAGSVDITGGKATLDNLSLTEALSISSGGTGANTVDGIRNNLSLGREQSAQFAHLDLSVPEAAGNSGILNLYRKDADGNVVSMGRLYHEVQSGIGKMTIHVESNGKDRYYQFDEDGGLSGLSGISTENVYASRAISANGWIKGGEKIFINQTAGGNREISLNVPSPAGDPDAGTLVNYLGGWWYGDSWCVGGVRGSGVDLDRIQIGLASGGTWADFQFRADSGGHGVAQRGWKGQCSQGAWGMEGENMGSPFWASSVTLNDSGWSPIVTGGSSSTGGYHMQSAFGTISNGNNAWPATCIKMLGDNTYHRVYNFTHSGDLSTWENGGFGGGDFIFAKNPTSDRDLKEDITYTDGKESYERVMQWLPTMFKYKGSDIQRYGLIAQDLVKIDYEYVKIVPGAPTFEDVVGVDENGEEYVDHQIETGRKDDTLALDINVLVADMACAMRYMTGVIENQERELSSLKDTVSEIVKKIETMSDA